MKFKIIIPIALSCLIGINLSCSNTKQTANKEEVSVSTEEDFTSFDDMPNVAVDYRATAEDGSWLFSITFDEQMAFMDRKNNIKFSTLESKKEVAAGANVVHAYGKNSVYEIKATIDVVDCNKNGKRIDIMVRRLSDNKVFDYSGCGMYRGDTDIHNVWSLYELNGERISPEKFPREFPHFEFDLAQLKMSGFAGCNQVNGNIRFDYNSLIIEPLISTRMYCSETSEIENEILKILRSSPIYKIKDLYLYLEIPGSSLILRKVE